tara:strand:+ start:596 stop:1294 length:699 start_codon:yes stop_codon:yes gene_type:complete
MILTAHQPTYLPWAGLFHKIWLADLFIFLDTVQYLPKEWMNRNYIRSKNEPICLSIPVLDKDFLKIKTNEIMINNNQNWQRKHLKSMYLNYKNEKYFDFYFNKLKTIYEKKYHYLSIFNYEILTMLLKVLEIKTEIVKSSDYNFKFKKSDLVLEMCKEFNASTFIFGEQGRDYAKEDEFKKNNVRIFYQNYLVPQQFNLKSKKNLSVIDLLFRYGDKTREIILSNQNNFDLK